MARLPLPPNPPACLPLNDEDYARLRRTYGPSLWTSPLRGCPTCGDRRWFRARNRLDGEIVEYDCDCEQQWLLHMWLLNAGIGTAYQRLSLNDVATIPSRVMTEVLGYLDPDTLGFNLRLGRGLLLWSKTHGTGKTMLSVIALKGVLSLGYDGYFTTFADLYDMYQSTWRDAEQKAWFDRRVRNVAFLVIDDIGKEGAQRSQDVKESMTDSVIRARNAAALPTIITTNFSPGEVDQGYGVASLLSGTLNVIEVDGTDYRKFYRECADRDVVDRIDRPIVML